MEGKTKKLLHTKPVVDFVPITASPWESGREQSRTQSNACSRVRLALALGKRNELRMISYALT